jgi:type IV secretion system protein VirD4
MFSDNTILISCVLLILVALIFIPRKKKPQYTYNAQFGDASDFLSLWNHGFAVTGKKALTKKLSYQNCLLCGSTGSGKSSVVIYSSIAAIARAKSSVVINNTSEELWSTSTYLQKKGYRVLCFNPSNASSSESFNPLQLCNSISDINKLAQIVVYNGIGNSSGEKFWEHSSIMVIAMMARYLRFHASIKYCTLQNVFRLIEKLATDGKVTDRLFLRTKDETLIESYKAVLVMGEKTLQSVIATARTALQLWQDPEVCKATATNTIDFSLMRKEPVALFINTPLKDLKYYKSLSSLFFQSLFDFVLSVIPTKHERSIFFLIDEFASMRFPDIALTVSNVRKFKGGLLLCVQDEMSLIAQYGQAEAHQIKTNCGTQVFLKGQPLHTAKELSQSLGRYSLVDENGKERGARELMTVDEIRLSEDAIILINNKPPLKCKPIPYYKNLWLYGLTRSKPIGIERKEVTDPPLLPIT